MSFSYGVGDIIATLKLADNLKKRFTQAPSEFKAISGEIKSLWAVLHDLNDIPQEGISIQQKSEIESIVQKGREVLLEIDDKLSKHNVLAYTTPNWKTRALRAWSRINWDPAEVNSLRSRITSCISLFNLIMGKINQDLTMEIGADVHSIKDNQDIQMRNETFSWICPTDPSEQQRKIFNMRHEGTGRWFLESKEFLQWLLTSEKKSAFLCNGAPGAGKTVLTSVVVDHLEKTFANDNRVGVTYLYFDFRKQLEFSDILSSLLRQLVQGNSGFETCVDDLCFRHRQKPGRLTETDLLREFELVLMHLGEVYFVVDALDECLDLRIKRQLFVWIRSIASSCPANFKVFTTTRHDEPCFSGFNDNNYIVEIKASREDMAAFLDANIDYLPGFIQRKPNFWIDVRNQIIISADGLFLLVCLYLNILFDEKNEKRVRTLLTQLRSGSGAYDHAYDQTMNRIKQQSSFSQDLAKRIMGWVTFSARPLTADELQNAIAVEIGEPFFDETNITDVEDMVSVCSGLVIIDKSSNTAKIAHFTAQEYLKRTQHSWFAGVHQFLTDTCLTYLSFDKFDDTCLTQNDPETELEECYPFYQYAAHEIGTHLRQSLGGGNGILRAFITNNAKVSRCMREIFGLMGSDCSFTAHHFASLFGLEYILELFPPKDNNFNTWDHLGRTPLTWAAGSGSETVVKLLLERGSDPNSATKDGCTPLFYAAAYGHVTITRLLIDAGANVNFQNLSHETPVFFAAKGGCEVRLGHKMIFDSGDHASVIKLLANAGANLEHKKDGLVNPIWVAAEHGNEEAVKIFIERDPDTQKSFGTIHALSAAAQRGHIKIAKMLLKSGTINPSDSSLPQVYHTLSLLMKSDEDEARDLFAALLKKCGDSTPQDEFKRTPLHWVASRGDLDLVQRILKTGSSPNPKNVFSRTPLLEALCMDRVHVAKELLDHPQIDVQIEDKLGFSPLKEAYKKLRSSFNYPRWHPFFQKKSITGPWEEVTSIIRAKMGLHKDYLPDTNVPSFHNHRFQPSPQCWGGFYGNCDVCLQALNSHPKKCSGCKVVPKKNGNGNGTVQYCEDCIGNMRSCPLCGQHFCKNI